MATPKSRLGRGLGNLIAGGISGAKPPAPATKPAPTTKPTVAKKPATAPGGNRAPAASAKPAPRPAVKAPAKPQVAAKPRPAPTRPAVKPSPAKAATKQPAQRQADTKPAAKTQPAAPAAPQAPTPATPVTRQAATPAASAIRHTTPAAPVTNKPVASTIRHTTPAASVTNKPVAPAVAAAAERVTPSSATPSTAAQAPASTAPVARTPATPAVSTPAPASARTPAPSAAATAANASPYREIAVSAVVPNPYQPRRDMDPEHIAELANSIASEGLLQPIVVRPLEGGKSYELIAGERRWRAHQKLGLKTIAARVMDASDSSSAVISLIENIQRQALNPIEEALGFASLMRDFDLTQEAVSERIGRARASIANALRLLGLDREIQGYVAKGLLSVGHAKILLGLEEPAQRLLVARRIIEGGISVRETEALIKRLKSDKHARPGGATSISEADRTAIADLEKQLSSRLNTKVQLRHTPKKGRIVIEYYGNEDLQRILERTGLQL